MKSIIKIFILLLVAFMPTPTFAQNYLFSSSKYSAGERHEVTHAQPSSKDVAIDRAKAFVIATANGDVAKLKQLMRPDFYKECFPYNDSIIKIKLLSVPLEQRQKMINFVKYQSLVSTIINRAGDVITVIFGDENSGKDFCVQLLDEEENGDWRIFNYWQ